MIKCADWTSMSVYVQNTYGKMDGENQYTWEGGV